MLNQIKIPDIKTVRGNGKQYRQLGGHSPSKSGTREPKIIWMYANRIPPLPPSLLIWGLFLCGCLLVLNWESPGISCRRMRVLSKLWLGPNGGQEGGQEGHRCPPTPTTATASLSLSHIVSFSVCLYAARCPQSYEVGQTEYLIRMTSQGKLFAAQFFFLCIFPSPTPLSSQHSYSTSLFRSLDSAHSLTFRLTFICSNFKPRWHREYKQMLAMKYLSRKL